MTTETQPARPSRPVLWIGRVISTLPVLMLLMSAGMKLAKSEQAMTGFRQMGFTDRAATAIGITELVCTILYIVPQTAVLGAILLIGYLGGAVVTHVREGQQFVIPVLLGVLLWFGLFLRDRRLRVLIPFRF